MNDGATVLTIDDDDGVRRAFVTILQGQGYRMLEAVDGLSGLEVFREQRPDVVLLDLRMPGMDGLDVLSRITAESSDTAVIVVSGADAMRDAVQALKRGAWDFVTKPIEDISLLEAAVSRGLERAALRRQNREHREHLERLNRELSVALAQLRADQEAGRHLQFQLLPPDGAVYGGYRCERRLYPSTILSGDFVDYVPFGGRFIALYIADVSGHGAASACVTVMIKTLVRRFVDAYLGGNERTILRPAEVLGRLDRDLRREHLDKHATMFFAVIDTREHTMTYGCGGHFPYPIVYADGHASFLTRPSFPLGLFDDATFDSFSLRLPEDFRLLVFSDGILEQMGGTLHDKQDELCSVAAGTQLSVDRVFPDEVTDASTPLLDDVALLLVQRESHG